MARLRILFAIILFLAGITIEANAMDEKWFQTWDRPEYQEWAIEIPEGYLLHIIRKENSGWLVVQAKLIMGNQGLPGFEVIEQQKAADEQTALDRIKAWESAQITCVNGQS